MEIKLAVLENFSKQSERKFFYWPQTQQLTLKPWLLFWNEKIQSYPFVKS